jgi:hypothetical protein
MATVSKQDAPAMNNIAHFLESIDLTLVHFILGGAGTLLSVYAMKLIDWEAEDDVDPQWQRLLRRIGYVLMAWGMLWSLDYSFLRGWQPWPSELLTIFAIDIVMFTRIMGIKSRIWRDGVKPEAPRAQYLRKVVG